MEERPLFADKAWQPKPGRARKGAEPSARPVVGLWDFGIVKVQQHPAVYDDLLGCPSWSVFFQRSREPQRIWPAL